MKPLHSLSVAELGQGLRARQFSAVELTQALLQRVTEFSPPYPTLRDERIAEHMKVEPSHHLGAFLHVNADAALASAKAADERLEAGDSNALLGIPLAHKDIFVTQDMPTTAGSKMLAGYASPFDATVVARLKQAGMVSLGKLNCDEFAMGSANNNSAYGPARNPWDSTRVPGGSSGGSAAADRKSVV